MKATQEMVCGHAGYSQCWMDCPLPAPYFNHAALCNAISCVAFIFLGIAFHVAPDIAPDFGGSDGDGDEVDSDEYGHMVYRDLATRNGQWRASGNTSARNNVVVANGPWTLKR